MLSSCALSLSQKQAVWTAKSTWYQVLRQQEGDFLKWRVGSFSSPHPQPSSALFNLGTASSHELCVCLLEPLSSFFPGYILLKKKTSHFHWAGQYLHFGEYIFNEVLMIFTETMKWRMERSMLNKRGCGQIRSLGLRCTGGKIAKLQGVFFFILPKGWFPDSLVQAPV